MKINLMVMNKYKIKEKVGRWGIWAWEIEGLPKPKKRFDSKEEAEKYLKDYLAREDKEMNKGKMLNNS